MPDSSATFLAILFGLGVFAVIVVIGWRSVQNLRILRLRSASGQETIIVARDGDEVSSVVTTDSVAAGQVSSVATGTTASSAE